MLAGYPTYRADRYYRCYRRLPATLQAAASGAANTLLRPSYRKVSTDYKVRQFLASRGLSTERAHYWWRVIFAEAEKRRLMTADLLAEIGDYDPFDAFRDAFSRVERASFLDRALYVDSVTWLPSDILVKVDRTSMAHGLEVRTPFLDHRLVEYCARLPAEMKMVGGRQKVVLRDALRNVLPDDVLDGPKHGFNAPTLPLSRTIPGRASVSAGLAAGFTLDSRREDITFKGFALSILETWLTLGNLQGHI